MTEKEAAIRSREVHLGYLTLAQKVLEASQLPEEYIIGADEYTAEVERIARKLMTIDLASPTH